MRPDRLRSVLFLAALAVWCAGGLALNSDVAAQSSTSPTFSRDVAPIFYNKCVGCHRPGEVAPMSLITYRDVRPWASAIREKVPRWAPTSTTTSLSRTATGPCS